MMRFIGWVLIIVNLLQIYPAIQDGQYLIAFICGILALVMLYLQFSSPVKQPRVYTAILGVHGEESNYFFPIGVANSLTVAAALVKLEAMARRDKTAEVENFTTDDDFYFVQERILNSSFVTQEFNFTRNGDIIAE